LIPSIQRLLTRRDFLRLVLLAGGTTALSPLLKACSPEVPFGAPVTDVPALPSLVTGSTGNLLDGLEGLGIDDFFEQAYRRWLVRDPEGLTALGLADQYGVGDANLTDISDAFIRQTQVLEAGSLDLLRRYDRGTFSAAQTLTADIYDWFLDDLVRGHPFLYDDYPVNPVVTSVHFNLYSLFTIYHPLNNLQDAEDYRSRLSQVGRKLADLIDGLQRRRDHGVILPAFIIPIVLDDLDGTGRKPANTHPYYTTFTDRLTGVSADERADFLERVETEIKATVIPAYQQLSGFLTDLQAEASYQVGVWQIPEGTDYYAQCLRHHTTTGLNADEIHELGLQHLERIHAEMRSLFAGTGYPEEQSIASLYDRLTNDSGVYQGQAAVDAYEQAIRGAEAFLPQAFDIFPRAEVVVVGGPQGDYYTSPPYDGSRPGVFYARTDGATPCFGVKTLAYHETIPGHHTQIVIGQEQTGLPDLRREVFFTAYAEGWALYAERLMWELGAYTGDPQGDLGRLQAEAFRAARLVVDTGIHARQWGFDKAVETLSEATGFPTSYSQGQITRYSVWPGQATAYYMGFLKILEMRQKAMDALGERFDLKAFHRLVLQNGAMPLSILENQVDSYIQSVG
jgi:uncharacterized protein (DUF885 family)